MILSTRRGALHEELHSALLRAWQDDASYRSCPLDVPVVLFRSEEHIADEPDDLGWRLLCPRLRVINVSGGHKSMLRAPYLDGLSACFIREVNHAVATPDRRLVA